MQVAYNRAQVGTRAAEWINPKKGELLIPDRVSAYRLISQLESQLKTCQLPRHKRAEILIARSMVYEAIGDQKMMEAAEEAFTFTKTSTTAHMMAVAHHHFGRIQEACNYYTLAFRFPHEQGFNVDLAYTQALLFQGKWSEAHRMTLGLKKRMVYAAYLPEWDRSSGPVSIISEGGFGDLIQCGRWIPHIMAMVHNKATVYLPPFFFNAGFVDLWRRQPWCPEIKLLTEVPQKVPAVGFFDLPAVFDVQPDAIPPSLTFKADSELVHKYRGIGTVGFCWAARQQETPLVPDGVYRALTKEQAQKIIDSSESIVQLVNLQLNETLPGLHNPEIRSWEDTCAIIENLDAVITVDTAIAHLAAAMGKPTYVLLSGASDWKFGMSGETTPWYPSMKLIRNDGWGFEQAVEKVISLIENAQFHHHLSEDSTVLQNVL
jgi:hypothetical protein